MFYVWLIAALKSSFPFPFEIDNKTFGGKQPGFLDLDVQT
jgi:hypothetical protein